MGLETLHAPTVLPLDVTVHSAVLPRTVPSVTSRCTPKCSIMRANTPVNSGPESEMRTSGAASGRNHGKKAKACRASAAVKSSPRKIFLARRFVMGGSMNVKEAANYARTLENSTYQRPKPLGYIWKGARAPCLKKATKRRAKADSRTVTKKWPGKFPPTSGAPAATSGKMQSFELAATSGV